MISIKTTMNKAWTQALLLSGLLLVGTLLSGCASSGSGGGLTTSQPLDLPPVEYSQP